MYVVVFACDLLLSIGLIVLALEHVITEQGMLANLDKGASQRPNPLNHALRSDLPPQRS
jgi:hypothetical protein